MRKRSSSGDHRLACCVGTVSATCTSLHLRGPENPIIGDVPAREQLCTMYVCSGNRKKLTLRRVGRRMIRILSKRSRGLPSEGGREVGRVCSEWYLAKKSIAGDPTCV